MPVLASSGSFFTGSTCLYSWIVQCDSCGLSWHRPAQLHCRKFTDMPSVQTNDALAVGLRITLNSSAAVQPAAQLETRLGRPALQNALFPQGSDSICSFLQEHNPDSQVTCSRLNLSNHTFASRCTSCSGRALQLTSAGTELQFPVCTLERQHRVWPFGLMLCIGRHDTPCQRPSQSRGHIRAP